MDHSPDIRVEAVANERAPKYPGAIANLRILCADGFSVSVQASNCHYSDDSGPDNYYWAGGDRDAVYPYVEFEVGFPSVPFDDPRWDEFDSSGDDSKSGPWAYVPRALVDELIESHDGSIGWTETDSGQ